jgi:hypothetical protein
VRVASISGHAAGARAIPVAVSPLCFHHPSQVSVVGSFQRHHLLCSEAMWPYLSVARGKYDAAAETVRVPKADSRFVLTGMDRNHPSYGLFMVWVFSFVCSERHAFSCVDEPCVFCLSVFCVVVSR